MHNKNERAIVIKFGGSAATNIYGASSEYFHTLFRNIETILVNNFSRAIFVIGGGERVREEQKKFSTNEEKDRAGIRILHEHATQLAAFARAYAISVHPIVPRNEDEVEEIIHSNRYFAAALGGLRVGQSTDAVAITAAEFLQKFGYEATVCILSNVEHIFTRDPKLYPQARPIKTANIHTLVQEGVLVDNPSSFVPGMHVAIDPTAVKKLESETFGFIPTWFGRANNVQSIHELLALLHPATGTRLVRDAQKTEYYY